MVGRAWAGMVGMGEWVGGHWRRHGWSGVVPRPFLSSPSRHVVSPSYRVVPVVVPFPSSPLRCLVPMWWWWWGVHVDGSGGVSVGPSGVGGVVVLTGE